MSKMHEILLSKFPKATQQDLDAFSKSVRQSESSGGINLVNPDSSARGDFQFLTKGDGNSFQTALNRLSNTYAAEGESEPDWIDKARRDNDPIALPYAQQEDLMLANIYQQKGSDELLSKAFTGDRDASLEAYYKYHHTSPDAATIANAESSFKTEPRQVVAEVPMEDRQYNLERVSAGVPSLPSTITRTNDMSTEKKPAGFGGEWLSSLLGVDPDLEIIDTDMEIIDTDMDIMDYFKSDSKKPEDTPTDIKRLASNVPVIPLQQTADQVVPFNGTMPYISQGTVDRGLSESLKPAMSMQEAAYRAAPQAMGVPHAAEFSAPQRVGELSANGLMGDFVAPEGREPAAVAVEQQKGVLRDQFGNPVTSGNGNIIGLPTQNPAFKAPAGGKGSNATPQSAVEQLTGIKGIGGK